MKQLHQSLSSDEHFRRLFQRELKVMEAQSHPGIVALFGAGVVTGGPGDEQLQLFLVMEYCEQGSLEGVLRGGAGLPDGATVRWALQIAEVSVLLVFPTSTLQRRKADGQGLVFLHGRERVHRDIKSGNILLRGPDLESAVAKVRMHAPCLTCSLRISGRRSGLWCRTGGGGGRCRPGPRDPSSGCLRTPYRSCSMLFLSLGWAQL